MISHSIEQNWKGFPSGEDGTNRIVSWDDKHCIIYFQINNTAVILQHYTSSSNHMSSADSDYNITLSELSFFLYLLDLTLSNCIFGLHLFIKSCASILMVLKKEYKRPSSQEESQESPSEISRQYRSIYPVMSQTAKHEIVTKRWQSRGNLTKTTEYDFWSEEQHGGVASQQEGPENSTPPSGHGLICVEVASSPHFCVGFLQVCQLPQSK